MIEKDVIIIGGGPAGLAAAIRLKENGIDDILVLEREKSPGGILRQCIHDGFGLIRFGESLSGPEYAWRFLQEAMALNIPIITETTVIGLTYDRVVTAVSRNGLVHYKARAVVLTMGCRERTRGAIGIPGARPAGVMTAGVAQSYINLHNLMVGKEIVILGSGDIGLIMARRFSLEGAKVKAVLEALPYPSGLPRNIEQCLNDYGIPLYLSHTVTRIHGKKRVEGVSVAQVDANLRAIAGTEQSFSCDTLILSVGLIPENELSRMAGVEINPLTQGAAVDDALQTSVPGVFAAGNVLHVHDLVDFVSIEAEELADAAADYLKQGSLPTAQIPIRFDEHIGHVVPQAVSAKRDFKLSLRVRRPMRDCVITVCQAGQVLHTKKMRKALPAEMIQLTISAEKLTADADVEVCVQ